MDRPFRFVRSSEECCRQAEELRGGAAAPLTSISIPPIWGHVESSPNRILPALVRGFDDLRPVEQRAATTPAKLQPQFAMRAEAHEFKRVVVWLAIN
jgi:hypothetical protein